MLRADRKRRRRMMANDDRGGMAPAPVKTKRKDGPLPPSAITLSTARRGTAQGRCKGPPSSCDPVCKRLGCRGGAVDIAVPNQSPSDGALQLSERRVRYVYQ